MSLLAKHQGEDFKMETVSKSMYYLTFKAQMQAFLKIVCSGCKISHSFNLHDLFLIKVFGIPVINILWTIVAGRRFQFVIQS